MDKISLEIICEYVNDNKIKNIFLLLGINLELFKYYYKVYDYIPDIWLADGFQLITDDISLLK